jgi:hypothetical protein
MNRRLPFRWTKFIVLGLILLAGSAGEVLAANLRIEAKLVWATDEAKSPDPKHKLMDAATSESLRKTFKWKNYFEVNRVVKEVPARSSNKFELSKRCTIEITELEGPKIAVKLIGEGKELHKTTLTISKGKSVVYSGDDKNQNAWFVIITQLEEK